MVNIIQLYKTICNKHITISIIKIHNRQMNDRIFNLIICNR